MSGHMVRKTIGSVIERQDEGAVPMWHEPVHVLHASMEDTMFVFALAS